MPIAKLCLLSLLITLAACTAQPKKVADAGPDLQCHKEQLTGTMITKTVCTTAAERAAGQAHLDAVRAEAERGPAGTAPAPQH